MDAITIGATQAAPGQVAQELDPERFGLAVANRYAEHLAPSLGVYADRAELRSQYPPNWRELSRRVRFERAGGQCQSCGRPNIQRLRCLPDGWWFDEAGHIWRDRRGRPAKWPDLLELSQQRVTRVVLAAAHLNGNPANNRLRNLRSLCQRIVSLDVV